MINSLPAVMKSQVKFWRQQYLSGASQQNGIAESSQTTEVDVDQKCYTFLFKNKVSIFFRFLRKCCKAILL